MICYVRPFCRQSVRSSAVVKVLCYKSEGRWFDPSWCQWIFPLPPGYNPIAVNNNIIIIIIIILGVLTVKVERKKASNQ